jgi:hypothetical protein
MALETAAEAPGEGTLALLLPPGTAVAAARRDGAAFPFEVRAVGADAYAVLRTDWRPHRFELDLR